VKVSVNVKEMNALPSAEWDATGAMVALKAPLNGIGEEA